MRRRPSSFGGGSPFSRRENGASRSRAQRSSGPSARPPRFSGESRRAPSHSGISAGGGHSRRGPDAKQERSPRRGVSRHARGGRSRSTQSIGTEAVTRPLSRRSAKHPEVPPAGDNIRIIPLGGVEEVGRNMTLIEYKNDIVIIDAGFQFREDSTPGIDYILPNTKYLEDRKDKIRGIIITHGHLDHVGGIPYILPRLGNPPIYSRNLTTVLIKKRQEEFPHLPPLDIRVVEKEERVKLGDLTAEFFAVTHTIPDAMGVIIGTPYGDIVATGDLKLDHKDGVPSEDEEGRFKTFEKRKVLLLMSDSTNVERPGFSIPEWLVQENINKIIKETHGRLVVAAFSSLLERAINIIQTVERVGKKIAVDGRSMKTNVEVAKQLGLLKEDKTIIPIDGIENYPPGQVVVLATGSQGEEFSALMRISDKRHKHVQIKKGDTVLLSSSIVPGNERSVQKLKDNLSRQGARIIHYQTSDVHSSGHANRDESAWIISHIKPMFFMPMHGYHYMLTVHADIAASTGIPRENIIVPDNGMVLEIADEGKTFYARPERAPAGLMMVDGFSIGDMQDVVIRDRQALATDGMFVIIAILDTRAGTVKKSPDIISRGFVYLRESQDLLHQARIIASKTIERSAAGARPINFDLVKDDVTDAVGKFLFQKTNKHPIVIPVIIGV